MDKKKKKAWHRRVFFKVFKWYKEGEIPPFINLCRYVRAVVIWAPLKAIFYSPWRALFRKNKILFFLVMLALFGAVETVLALWNPFAAIYFGFIVAYFLCLTFSKRLKSINERLESAIANKWQKAGDTRFVRYSEGTGRVLKWISWYVLGLPLKTIFWTVWVKIYDFSPVLFGSVLTLVVGGLLEFLIFVGLWKVAAIIGGIIGALLLFVLIMIIVVRVDLDENLIWQRLKAKKSKICPILDLREEE